METTVLLVLAAFVASMAVFAATANRSSLRKRFHSARRMPISALEEGRICKLVGRVQPADALLTAPLSGKACVLYEVRVESKTEDSAFFRPVLEKRGVPFWVEEKGERVFVTPAVFEVWLVRGLSGETGVLRAPPSALKHLLRRHRRSFQGRWAKRSFIYDERVLVKGDQVALIGSLRRERDTNVGPDVPSYRTSPTRTRMLSSRRHPLLVSNRPEAISSLSL